MGRLVSVATLVNHRVHFQPIVGTRAIHELPQSRGSHTRSSHGIHRRLHNGQVLQFLGDTVAVQRVEEQRPVVFAEHQHHVEATRHILEIESYMGAYLAVECHRNHGMERLQTGNDNRVGNIVEILHRKLLSSGVPVFEAAHIVAVDEAVVRVGILLGHQLHLRGGVVGHRVRLRLGWHHSKKHYQKGENMSDSKFHTFLNAKTMIIVYK